MKETKYYECEFCHTQYKDKDKAIQCEKNHHVPKVIEHCKYHAAKDSKNGYPDYIEVVFEDGEYLRYRR